MHSLFKVLRENTDIYDVYIINSIYDPFTCRKKSQHEQMYTCITYTLTNIIDKVKQIIFTEIHLYHNLKLLRNIRKVMVTKPHTTVQIKVELKVPQTLTCG